MGQVVGTTVFIGTAMVEAGTRREDVPQDVVGQIGDHIWVEESQAALVGPDGEGLTGLRSAVHIDGKMYEAGTVPPDDVLPNVGAHMWVPGFVPPIPGLDENGEPGVPPVDPGESSAAPLTHEIPDAELEEAEGGDAGPEQVAPSEPDPGPAEAGDEPVASLKPPARSGRGSSLEDWKTFAAANQVDVHAEAERHEVIEACEQAGLIPAK